MLKLNVEQLVEMCVIGEVSSPAVGDYRISPEGKVLTLGGLGGIAYNVKVGDRALGWAADHLEPGASCKHKDSGPNLAFNLLSCIGNPVRVVSGEAKGAKGIVTGKHGGIEHVIVDFPDSALEKMLTGDSVAVRAFGVGLQLVDFPHIRVMNISPDFLKKMHVDGDPKTGELAVPVAKIIPAKIMGSGLGSNNCARGDYDIQMFDDGVMKEYGLDRLRLGDIVAIQDADHSYGRIYREGAVSIGIVSHGGCVTAGHGPGVTTLLTSPDGKIKPVLDDKANIGGYMKIGRFRRGKAKKR